MSELSEAAEEKLNPPAAEAPKRRGRPLLPRDSQGNIIRKPKSAPQDTGEEEAAPFVYIYDENSVKASMAMGVTVWWLASKMLPVRELTEEEGYELGKALDPVLCKWIPILGEWKYEAALLMTITTLYMATKIEKKPLVETPAEEVDATRSATG